MWFGSFESTNFIFLSLNSCLRYITITVTEFYTVKNFCFFKARKYHMFSIWVFAIKQRFQKGKLQFTGETVELQKKQNWITANKLILNLSLVFNPQMKEIVGKTWILAKSQ